MSLCCHTEDLHPTRKTLVGKLANLEDTESWREFFEIYWKLIYAFAVKAGCTDTEAEEVVQETIISVSRKMPEFKYDPAICSFKGWLMHVANWRVIDQLRKRNHRLVAANADPETATTDLLERIADPLAPELERLWDEEWRRNLMDAALERVKRRANPQHYQAFYLSAIKTVSIGEVARMLGMNRAQVYLAKHRVGSQVQREIKQLQKKTA